jgi:hypothetical protein
MKKLIILIPLIICAGCATEYYPPQKGEKQGAIKRKGALPWSTGKVLSVSVIGK